MNIRSGFYDKRELADSFFEVQTAVYPHLNLKWANDQNLLRAKVVPFAVFDENNRAISILNASHMKVHIRGRDFQAIQIGTVATLPDYRQRGLAGMLQRHVLEEYDSKVDFQFLFANPSVLEFYPKFGFYPIQQVTYKGSVKPHGDTSFYPFELDEEGVKLLKRLLIEREGLSNTIDTPDTQWLAEFYSRTFFADDLWVNENRDTILVATVNDSVLDISDVISPKIPQNFFSTLCWEGVSEIVLGFTPDRFKGIFEAVPLPEDEQIFVRGDFPSDLHNFKFPALAYT